MALVVHVPGFVATHHNMTRQQARNEFDSVMSELRNTPQRGGFSAKRRATLLALARSFRWAFRAAKI